MNELRGVVWRQAAGLVLAEELPMVAARALARGVDSPALRELAGLGRRADTIEILDVYRRALDELGLPTPSVEEATRTRLFELADGLVAGALTAQQVTEQCGPAEAWMTELEFGFASLACHRQDFVDVAVLEQVEDHEADLSDAARVLLDGRGQSAAPTRCP